MRIFAVAKVLKKRHMPDRCLMMTECDPGVMADRKSGAAPDVKYTQK